VSSREEKVRAPESAPEQPGAKASYEPPRLVKLGDVRSNILGPSPGFGDSPSNRTV